MPTLIKYPTRISPVIPPHHQRIYGLATTATVPLIISILLFWLVTHGEPSAVVAWEILPQSYLVILVLIFIVPYQRLSRAGRYRFLTTLRRVSIGGIAETQDGKFGDILLADVLTSYAKVLGDLFVSGCMFLSFGRSSTNRPDRSCGGQYIVPIVISIPSIIRMRQCLIEYARVKNDRQKPPGSGWGGQHLANALKYSSAFPVIILSALQRGYDPNKIGMSETGLFRLWQAFNYFQWLRNFMANDPQAFFCISQLLLFILLGCSQRLGSHSFLPRMQQPRASMGSPAAYSFSHSRDVLRSHNNRSNASLYVESEAFSAFRSLE